MEDRDDSVTDNEPVYLTRTSIQSNHTIDRLDVILLAILWVITAWSVIADRLCDEKTTVVSDNAKFWIGLTVPICTATTACIKSIQVGMEKHDADSHAGGILEAKARTINYNTIQVGGSDPTQIDATLSLVNQLSRTPQCTVSHSKLGKSTTLIISNPAETSMSEAYTDEIDSDSDSTNPDELKEFEEKFDS